MCTASLTVQDASSTQRCYGSRGTRHHGGTAWTAHAATAATKQSVKLLQALTMMLIVQAGTGCHTACTRNSGALQQGPCMLLLPPLLRRHPLPAAAAVCTTKTAGPTQQQQSIPPWLHLGSIALEGSPAAHLGKQWRSTDTVMGSAVLPFPLHVQRDTLHHDTSATWVMSVLEHATDLCMPTESGSTQSQR